MRCGVCGRRQHLYLLKWVRESKFDVKLKELLANDKVYVGVSAGSIVVGTSIEISGVGRTADKNQGYVEDLRGLRQVPFMVAVHMNSEEKFILINLLARGHFVRLSASKAAWRLFAKGIASASSALVKCRLGVRNCFDKNLSLRGGQPAMKQSLEITCSSQ